MLLKVLLKKEFIIAKRYMLDSLAGAITLFVIFLLIFFGYKALAGNFVNSNTIEGVIVGYVVWILALSAFQNVTFTIEDESKTGTLELLYMTKYNLIRVLITKAFAQFLIDIVLIVSMITAIILTTRKMLHLNIVSILITILFITISFWGIGFICGGFTLIFKRIGNYMQILQFAFMGLLVLPYENNNIFINLIPGASGLNILRKIMIENFVLTQISISDMLILILSSLFYLFVGVFIFRLCEKKAVKDAILGIY